MRGTFVVLLPLLLLASPTGAQRATTRSVSGRAVSADTNPFCRDISEIIRDAATDFERDKGAYRTDFEQWVSTIVLPNAKECYIDELSFGRGASHDQSANLTCTWSSSGKDDAISTASALAVQLRTCVGPNWPASVDRSTRSGDLYGFRLSYTPVGAGADFRIRVHQSDTRPVPTIYLKVTSTYIKPSRPLTKAESDAMNFDPNVKP